MNLQIVVQKAAHGPSKGKPIVQVFDFDRCDKTASVLFPKSYKNRKMAQAAIDDYKKRNHIT